MEQTLGMVAIESHGQRIGWLGTARRAVAERTHALVLNSEDAMDAARAINAARRVQARIEWVG